MLAQTLKVLFKLLPHQTRRGIPPLCSDILPFLLSV